MFDLHIFSRFLRLVRSIRRSLLAFFVAIAMLLATFVIAPAYALSAGGSADGSADGKTNTEQTEGAKADGAGGAKADGAGGAKADGAQKQGVQQSEPNKTESDKKNTDTSSTLNKDNKESKPDSKQQPDNNKAVNKAGNKADDNNAKSADKTGKTVEKSAENKKAKNKVASTDSSSRMNRSARKPKECKGLNGCYRISYDIGSPTVNNDGKTILIKRGETRPITPKYELRRGKTPAQDTKPLDGLWFTLEKDGEDSVPSWANFEKDNGATKVKDTSNDKKDFDGSVTLRPGKWDRGDHKFKIGIYRTDQDKKIVNISVKIDESDISKNDLSLSLYDFVKKKDKTPVSDNKIITINPKSKDSTPSGGTAGSGDKKDVYDSINKLFIDSQSKDKPGFIYHRMICHETGSGDNASYTVDKVNGLSLSDKDGSTTEKQTWFKHVENNKPTSGADKYSVYLNDDTERSQSWISGTPAKAGTFGCKVFAIKDVDYKITNNSKKPKYIKIIEHFNDQISNADGIKNLFNKPDSLNSFADTNNTYSIDKTIDWDYKSITIEVKSSEPPKPTIGDNDLTLKVYPFKNIDGSLPAELPDKNNKISAMLGMELKPFIDATSAADSKNKITLRVLCSKGEKKAAADAGGGGSAVGDSNGATAVDGSSSSAQSGSQSEQPSGSSQAAKDLEYKTWSSNLAELGLSVPADNNQNTCHSNKEGEKTCKSSDPSKKVAARTDMEVSIKPSIKPTEVGDYQCVVFALKPDALTKFDTLTGDATQSGSLTPESIKSELTKASPASFKEHKDFATFAFNLHLVSNFTLPNTGGQSWNLQLGILAALLVNLLAAGFVVSQSERGRKLILGRWRGLCNYV